jgi:hypothetical protein
MWHSGSLVSSQHNRVMAGRWLIVAFALMSCVPARPGKPVSEGTQHAAGDSPVVSGVFTREAALAVARAEVVRQPAAAKYLPDSLVLIDAGDRWEVRVPREGGAHTRPAYGLFFIQKATGEIQWVPQR